MFELLNIINDYLWTHIVITLLVFCALYFTFRLKGVQFSRIGDMLRVRKSSPAAEKRQ